MQNLYMTNPQSAYRKQNILTASPVELIVMLFDGLRKDIRLACLAMEKKDIAASHKYLMKAQDIVCELINCLDLRYPISSDLMSLYEFMLHVLGEANAEKDPERLVPLLEIAETLRDTWREVADTQRPLERAAGQETLC